MSDVMKLFGMTIHQTHLPSVNDSNSTHDDDDGDYKSLHPSITKIIGTSDHHHNFSSSSSSFGSVMSFDHKNDYNPTRNETEDSSTNHLAATAANRTELPSSSQNTNSSIKEGEKSATNSSGGGGSGVSSQLLKKPEKILPCPRCKSTDTKFCYFNNYNVNQPRHFCRCCQRYWTAGGTMRNVPVGSGRRNNNNKNSSSLHHQQQQQLKVLVPNPTDESGMGMIYFNSAANLSQQQQSSTPHRLLPAPPPPSHHYYWTVGPYWFPPQSSPVSDQYSSSNRSTTTASTSRTDESPAVRKRARDEEQQIPQSDHKEVDLGNVNKSLVVPKTLRMTDPREAAKSSIWATLGRISGKDNTGRGDRSEDEQLAAQKKIKSNNNISMLNGFRSEDEEEAIGGQVLQANPAALSMSVKFREIAQ